MYVALFPCNECAKLIIQSGIRKVRGDTDRRHKETVCDLKASRDICAVDCPVGCQLRYRLNASDITKTLAPIRATGG